MSNPIYVGLFLLCIGSTYSQNIVNEILPDEKGDFAENIVIGNIPKTTFGKWASDWDKCKPGHFATGFIMKVESAGGDDTALNGIRLYCNKLGENYVQSYTHITSTVGEFGKWEKTPHQCRNFGLLTGFDLRTEGSQGVDGDDTAANDIKFQCNGGTAIITSEAGMDWGSFSGHWESCQLGYAICGIKTQVESSQGSGDDTALNNVQFLCCEVPKLAEGCSPEDSYFTVYNETNATDDPVDLTYKVREGIADVKSNSLTKGEQVQWTFGAGMEGGFDYKILKAKFGVAYEHSKLTRTDWTSTTSATFSKETEYTVKISVEPHTRVEMKQVLGKCGTAFKIYAKEYIFETTKL